MSLTIGRLRTRTSLPRRLRAMAPVVDRLVREALPRACARELAAAWPARPAICRIRRLHVRMEVSPRGLSETSLTNAWAAAFCRALVSAINQPPGRDDVVVADSRAEWVAAFLLDLVNGTAAGRWAYEEFGRYADAPAGDGVLGVLTEEPSAVEATLGAVARRGDLGRLLTALGGRGCDRLADLIDRQSVARAGSLSLADLVVVGRLALEDARGGPGPLATSARALAIYVARRRAHPGAGDGDSPGRILAALRTLERLRQLGPLVGAPAAALALDAVIGELRSGAPPDVASRELLGAIRALVASGAGAAAPLLRELDDVVAALRTAMPEGAGGAPTAGGRWVTSRWAGLFLLVDPVRRLGWPEALWPSLLWARHGSRALTYVLAGVGLAIVGRSSADVDRLDPGVALFAGWMEEPHLAGFAHCLATASTDVRQDLLRRLVPETDASERCAGSWDATFDGLAERLVTAFAERIRGFRKASRGFVVERCLAAAGRVTIEPARLAIVLESNPLWVAVHLSGLDEPIDGVSWLEGRRVELRLEGV